MSGRARTALSRTRLRLPIRLKLAVVSAGLTFVILLLFALVIGAVTEQRIRGSFDDDLRATAADLQERTRVQRDLDGDAQPGRAARPVRGAPRPAATPSAWSSRTDAVISSARPAPPTWAAVRGACATSAPTAWRPARSSRARSTAATASTSTQTRSTGAVAFVQYAKPRRNLQSTLDRLHLFLALGILGGTGLAFLAGFAVARRAMRPIAGLTRAAREVARTRDPAMTLPKPEANDEVAELADTLEDMLRQLDAARGETEAALERQREFVADASHELRTPLTSILANLELLEEELDRQAGPRDRETAAEIAGSALRSSQRMRRLVGDLLLLARADAAAGGSPRKAGGAAPGGPRGDRARRGARGRSRCSRATPSRWTSPTRTRRPHGSRARPTTSTAWRST